MFHSSSTSSNGDITAISANETPREKHISVRLQSNVPDTSIPEQIRYNYGLELDFEESRALKNWHFWTVVLEKTLESPLDCKEIQPVHSKGDRSWVFFGRNDAKAETPVLWPPHAKCWLIGKDSDAGRDWGQEEKGTTEDEMAGWHHRLDGCEFEWTPGVDDG